jgi:ligand-binding SRPBCC domain-containing protein
MKLHVLECEMLAPVSVRDAFEIFEDPRNLAKITPPWLNFRIVTPGPIEMRKGAEIDYEIRWAGIPIKWRSLISEYEPPFFFVDEQVRGPYGHWRHRHTFHPTEGGTVVADRVEYALPFGWIGGIVHALTVRRQLRQIFAYRQKVLSEMMRSTSISSG